MFHENFSVIGRISKSFVFQSATFFMVYILHYFRKKFVKFGMASKGKKMLIFLAQTSQISQTNL